jgi:tRNA A37 threonylcarbamoyladenosine biosynthesis protein TsaE
MMLREIERNIPIHQMHLDHDVNKIDPESDKEDISDLLEQAIMAVEWQHVMGKDYQDAVNIILTAEQFRNNEKLKIELNKKYNL